MNQQQKSYIIRRIGETKKRLIASAMAKYSSSVATNREVVNALKSGDIVIHKDFDDMKISSDCILNLVTTKGVIHLLRKGMLDIRVYGYASNAFKTTGLSWGGFMEAATAGKIATSDPNDRNQYMFDQINEVCEETSVNLDIKQVPEFRSAIDKIEAEYKRIEGETILGGDSAGMIETLNAFENMEI